MAVPAVGLGLDQDGSAALPQPLDLVGHGPGHFEDVVAVDVLVADAVPGGAGGERGTVLVGGGRELGVVVVLAEEDDGQVPYGGQVDGLVEHALGDRPVAEERHHHVTGGAQLGRGRHACGDGQPGADDAVGAVDAEARVGDVHGAAAAVTGARFLAHQLGHHRRGVQALGEDMAVAAMGGGDAVPGAERPAGADGTGLLTDRQVQESGDLGGLVELGRPLLEPADAAHTAVHFQELLRVDEAGSGAGAGVLRCLSHERPRYARAGGVPPASVFLMYRLV